ncbi:hypothetical protein MMC18_006745 [Xylographa bjoerkii]|nr:hypothetical protein [Xylographa bjoerkii]
MLIGSYPDAKRSGSQDQPILLDETQEVIGGSNLTNVNITLNNIDRDNVPSSSPDSSINEPSLFESTIQPGSEIWDEGSNSSMGNGSQAGAESQLPRSA